MSMDSITFGLGNTGSITEDSTSPSIVATGSIEFFDTDTDAGLFHVPYVIAVGTPLGSVSVNIFDDATGGLDNGFLAWTYTVSNAALQYLGLGETRVEQFTIQVVTGNGDGETKEITLSVTLTGTNDGPTFTGAAQTGSLGEDGALTATGDFAFTDVDFVDAHTVSATAAISGGVAGFNPSGAALEAMFAVTVDDAATGDGAGTVHWAFTGTAADFQYLKDGESLDIQYTVTVNDGQGGTSTRTVTLTINGEDDNPAIAAASVTGGVAELGSTAAGTPTVTGDASGEGANWVDLDHGEDSTLQVVAASGTGGAGTLASGAYTIQGTYGTLTLNEDGTYSYTLDNSDYNTQALDTGDAVSDVFDYTIASTDGSETQASSTISISITGSNDAPVLSASAPSATVIENTVSPSLQDLSESSTLTVVDVDANDTLSPSASAPVVKLNGDAYTLNAGASALAAALTFTPGTANSGSGLTNTITWVWDPTAVNLDFLSEGDSLTLTYAVSVNDGTNASNTQDIVITVIGTNDVPQIYVSGAAGQSLGDTLLETNTGLSSTGQMTVVDVDLNDIVTATTAVQSVTGDSGGISLAALEAMFSVTSGDLTASGTDTNGEVAWNFNSGTQAFNHLDQGDSLVITYRVTVDDGHGGTDDQDITITINGTNDAPVVTASSTPAAIAEGNGVTLSAANARSGSITVDDEDASSTLTVTDPNTADTATSTINNMLHQIRAAATFTWIAADGTTVNGSSVGLNGTATNQAPDTDTIPVAGGLSIADRADILNAFQLTTSGGTAGAPLVINWTFDNTTAAGNITVDTNTSGALPANVGPISVDFLAAGEKLVVDFPITVTDQNGATVTSHVPVTFAGAADTAQLASTANTGAVTEDATTTLTATGTRAFTEVDFSDAAPTFNKSYVSITTSPTVVTASSQYSDLSLALQDVASRLDVARTVTAGTNDGNIAWTFGVADSLAQFLKVGETVVVTYRITPVDGGSAVLGTGRNVVITITGTNDGPVAVADTSAVTESGLTPAGAAEAGIATATGNVLTNDTDVDQGDTKTVDSVAAGSMAAASGTGVATAVAGTYGSLTLNSDGTYTYTLDNGDADTQALAVGESGTDTFTYVMKDGSGATSTTTLTITVNGTNDGPTIGAGDMSGALVEDASTPDLTDTGSFAFGDVDLTDAHTVSVLPASGSALGGILVATVATDSTGTGTGAINWSYSVANSAAQHLAVGETATETFTVTVSDGEGGTVTQDVSVTVTGTNDAPTVGGVLNFAVTEGAGSSVVDALTGTGDADGDGLFVVPGTLPAGVTYVGGTGAQVTFDSAQGYTTGTVIGQNDWVDASPSSPANAIVDLNGNQVLRLANDPSSGDFGGPYAPALSISAGETTTGAAVDHMEFSFRFAPVQTAADGSRIEIDFANAAGTDRYNFMALEFTNGTEGLRLIQNSPQLDGNWANNDFNFGTGSVTLAGNIDPTAWHDVRVVVNFVDGADNDTISYYLDGVLVGTGTTFENFFDASNPTLPHADNIDPVSRIIFRAGEAGGNPFPADGAGPNRQGFYLDNLSYQTFEPGEHFAFDANNPAYDYLAAGETEVVTVNYGVSDGISTTADSLTFTVTGTNDGPTVSVADTEGAVTEDSDTPTLSDTGSITFDDLDLTDTHIVSATADSGNTLGGTLTPTITTDATGAGDGTVKWVYEVANSAAQYLADGETVVETFTVTIKDSSNATVTEVVEVTVTGTNDEPVITLGSATADINEAGAGDTTVSASGSFSVADVDVANMLTVSEGTTSVVWSGGTVPSGIASALTAALAFGVSDSDSDSNEATVDWTFDAGALDLNFLGKDETLTVTVPVTITDGTAPVTQNVVITITGTNDAPVISGGGDTASINEIAGLTGLGNSSPDTVTGNFTIADADTNGGVTFTSEFQGFTTNYSPRMAPTAGLTTEQQDALASALTFSPLVGNDGTVTWTYDVDNSVIDFLIESEVLTVTLLVTADDGNGSTATTTVAVTINGKNDQVQAGTVSLAGAWTEGQAAAPAISGTIDYTDADFQNHAVVTLKTGGSLIGTGGTFAASNAANPALDDGNGQVVWSYTLAPGAADYLADGETATETFRVRIIDGAGFNLDQIVTVTITGSNDAPVITSESAAPAAMGEDSALVANGSFAFDDVDLTDAHTTSVTLVTSGAMTGLLPTNAALKAMLATSVGTPATGAGAGAIDWAFTGNSADFQYLQNGETLTLTYTVAVVDDNGLASLSDSETVTITITGTNDSATITGMATGSIAEEAATVSGTLTATDADHDQSGFAVATHLGTYGTWDINFAGEWTYTLNNTSPAVQALGVGDTLTDTVTVSSVDGTASQVITITINGTNDTAVIGGVAIGSTTEETALTATGTLTITDVDTDEAAFQPQTNVPTDHGHFWLLANGEWTYTLDNSNVAVQALGVGDTLTDTMTVTAVDGTMSSVSVTINGTNDAAVIGGVATGSVVEDTTATATGALTITDVDTGEAVFQPETAKAGTYGALDLGAAGNWTYTLNNSASGVQALAEGQTVTDTISVLSADGTSHDIVVTVTGDNDAPEFAAVAVPSLNQTFNEDGPPAFSSGSIAFNDVDVTDTHSVPLITVALSGDTPASPIGSGTLLSWLDVTTNSTDMAASGSVDWTFSSGNSDFQYLDVGETLTITYTITVSDGQGGSDTQDLVVNVSGSNDGPVITAATSAGTLTEDSLSYEATGSVGGTNWSDADAGDVPAITQGSAGAATQAALTFDGSGSGASAGEATIAGTYGTLFLKADGTYRYVLDNAGSAVQLLDGDQAVTDVFNYTLSDGTATAASTITVGVQGTNDAAVITVTNPSDVTESDATAFVSFFVADRVSITDADTQDAAAAVDYVAGSGALSATGPAPAAGTLADLVTFNATTGAISYDRAAFNWLDGDESVTYTVNFNAASGDDGAVAQSFTFTINGQNDGPVAVADAVTLVENAGNTLNLITNDTDADKNEILSLTSFTVGTVTGLGTLTAGELLDIANDFTQSGNSLVFVPAAGLPFGAEAVYDRLNPGATATITINYVVTDDSGATSNGTYTLSITGAAENFDGTPIDDNPFNGSNGDDTMYGNAGDDNISGNSGNDTIYGGADDDIINGGSGDDHLYGGDGFDTLIGGSDTDTAYFDGPWAEYTIGNGSTPGTYTLTRDGVTDTIATVELISFNGLAPVAVATMFNDAPVAAAASFSLDENTASGTVVGSVVASDVDAPLGDTLSYAITSGNGASLFAINAATGQITLAGSPNFETAPSHSLVVTVTDLHGATATSAVTVTINDLNDMAPVFTSGVSASVAENALTSTVVYTAMTTDADGVGGPVTYSLGGADAAAFSIDSATGEVTLNASADYETTTSYSVDVIANDGANSTTQAVVVSVTDLNDNVPLFSSGSSASVNENVAAGSAVYTAAATDADPTFGAVSYSLSGTDASAFSINASTGEVTIIASPDREVKDSYDFTVTAAQGSTTTDQAVTLTINDLNDMAPVFTSGVSASVAENALTSTVVYTAMTTDADGVGGPVTYSLGGADAAAFSINAATGEVTLNASADFETTTSYSIDVIANDGVNSTTQAVVVSVTDLNDNVPLFSSGSSASVNENVAAGSAVYTAAATDADPTFGAVSYSLSGTDASAFSINASTGEVTIIASPDREVKDSYDFTVTAAQGSTTTDQAVTLTINDLNDMAPVFTSGVSASVAENALTSTVVYTAMTTDADGVGGPVTYSLGGADAAAFSIDSATGEVTLNASADYETTTSYSVDVIANDGANSTTQAVVVSVTDLNDNVPLFSSGSSASVNENVAAGSAVYTAAATDADAGFGPITYSLSGADASAFNIDGATGAVTIIASPDRETKASYDFTVTATQGSTTTDQAVTLTINDLNDTAPVFTSGDTATVAENAATSTVVYTAVTTDADGVGGPVTYSLGGADAAAFSINAATGEVTLNASADYETKTSYSVDVIANDGANSTTQAVAVSVNDLNDNVPLFSSGGSASVNENVAAGSTVYTAAATDADAGFGPVTYSLSGSDAWAFNIDANTGIVTIIDSPDRENRGSYSFTVTATQGVSTSDQAVSLTINDLNDSLPLITSASSATVLENAAASTVIYTATANDEDSVGGPVTFSLSGVDAGLFEINATNGDITLISSADFETQQTYDLMLTASDGVNSSTNILTINVTDENDEAPVITAPSTVSVAENTAPAAIVFTATSTDVDTTGETISYTLSGADAGSFTINAAGEVSFVASPDFEVKSSYSIEVVASDGANSSSQIVSVLITDVNDVAPVFTSGTTGSVIENAPVATIVYTATATDVDTVGGPITYTLGGADAAAFSINAAGEVTLNASADYEAKASYSIDVIASDGVNSSTQSVAVSVIDADDVAVGPVSVSGAQAANEVTSTGVVVATALALDPDTGSSVSYSLTNDAGGRFAINASTGAITVVDGILLDFEQATSHSVSVRATSSDGSFSDTSFSVAVNDVAVETVVGGAAGETVVGGNGNDSFTMNGGNDNVSGGDGNDVVNGGAGTNTLNGGAGTDTVSYAGAAAATTVRLNVGNANNGFGGVDALAGFENIIGSDFADTLIGNAGVNEMWGGLGSDYMIGLDGNDILHGGTGALNTMQGGRGDDVYYLDVSGDSIVELFAEGIDEVRTALGVHTLATNVENLTYIGAGTFLGVGNAGDNSITGGLLRDDIYGRDGNDTLNGGAGAANTMLGGLGNDIYIVSATGDSVVEVAGQGTDTVQTALGVYVMAVNVEILTYTGTGSFFGFGNAGDNIMTGGANSDSLYGYAGNDTLNGGGGTDTLLGGVGDDTYMINVAGVSIVEYVGEGTDTVQTSLATYVITSAHVENLTFTGSANALGIGNALGNVITSGAGNDQLNGNNGNDTLISTGGDDRFYGGNGNDTITTGLGQDRVFLSGLETGFDTVTDFASGSDLFFLNRASFGATASTAFVSGTGAMAATTANSTILHDTVTGQIFIDADGNGAGAAVQIAQVNPGQILAGSDFIFY